MECYNAEEQEENIVSLEMVEYTKVEKKKKSVGSERDISKMVGLATNRRDMTLMLSSYITKHSIEDKKTTLDLVKYKP